jgi:hypothetical protein
MRTSRHIISWPPSDSDELKQIIEFGKTIVTSNFQRIALRCENPSLYSSKNWLSKTKFDLIKLDE